MPLRYHRPAHRLGALLPLAVFLGGAALLLGAAGCEEDAGPLPANIPPQTYLTIQGADLDTVGYRQALRWWGSDPDGRVIGYCIHWDGGWEPPAGALRCAFDEEFVFTTATTDTFVVPTDGAFAERTFRVHAVDDDGVIDPDGRSQVFRLGNWQPELFWSQTIARPRLSLPAVSFACTARDLDGDETVVQFRVWLDGEDPATDARLFPDTLFALGLADFGGRFGDRTLHVQAVDEARAASNVIEHTWMVEPPPTERLLLIDNVSSDTPGEPTEDGYFRAIMDSVAPGDYFVYDVEERGDFRSRDEVLPLFELFQGVVWYGGTPRPENDASLFHNLGFAEEGLREYVDDGGKVLLVYRDAVGDSAGLSPAFAAEVAGIETYFRARATEDHNIRLLPGSLLGASGLDAQAVLEISGSTAGADFFLAAPGVEPLFWVEPGFLDSTLYAPSQVEDRALLGCAAERGAGRFGLVTFLLSRADRRGNARAAGAALLRQVLD